MKRIGSSLFIGLFAVALVSCENTTVEQDMNTYCDCRKKLLKGEADQAECQEIVEEISTKYEFDPEAYEQIKEEIAKCNEELASQND